MFFKSDSQKPSMPYGRASNFLFFYILIERDKIKYMVDHRLSGTGASGSERQSQL